MWADISKGNAISSKFILSDLSYFLDHVKEQAGPRCDDTKSAQIAPVSPHLAKKQSIEGYLCWKCSPIELIPITLNRSLNNFIKIKSTKST